MEISEYQPPPPRPSPPEPPRKNRSKFIMGVLFLLVFLGTLAVESRHEIAEHFRHDAPPPASSLTVTETAKQAPNLPTAPAPTQQNAANSTPPLPVQTSQAADNSPFK